MADVTMPQLGETVTEGTITKWFKKVGDAVVADEPLFEVSTDKVDTEVPSPVAGFLSEIVAQEGDTIQVGAVIARVGDAPGASAAAVEAAAVTVAAPAVEAPAATAPPVAAPAVEAPAAAAPPVASEAPPTPVAVPAAVVAPASLPVPSVSAAANGGDSRLLSPVVRKLVNDHGLDPDAIGGSGPGGRITREDVQRHIELTGAQPQTEAAPSAPAPVAAPAAAAPPEPPAPPAAPAPAPAPAPAAPAAPVPETAPVAAVAPAPAPPAPAPAPVARPAAAAAPISTPGARDDVVKLSKIRRLTGEHMIMSKAVTPHAFSVVEVDYANVDRVRDAHKGSWKAAEGFGLTYLPFISRAIVDALAEFPHLNASVSGTDLVVHRFVDLGIAVDLDYQGLLVPVVRDADTKRLRALAREINDLATRARARKLAPDEISGGTFTISNNGSAGSVLTSAIINQPQVAIISTDAIKRRPVAVNLPGGGEGIVIHSVGNLAMSWDHRAFDGAYAAGFLVKVKDILEGREWEAEL